MPAPVQKGSVLVTVVGLPDQQQRYVFTRPPIGVAEIAAQIDQPFVHLKAPMAAAAVRAMLPEHWHVEQTGTMMRLPDLPRQMAMVPTGYQLDLSKQDGITIAQILDERGAVVAQGRMIIVDGLALHDRITVDADHRRRGLGRAIMTALGIAAGDEGALRGILAATTMGVALYQTLGWEARSPWTTAQIPSGQPDG